MKAMDLINHDLAGKAIALQFEETVYVFNVDAAEIVNPDAPNGTEMVKLTYILDSDEEAALGNDFSRTYLLHPDVPVQLIERVTDDPDAYSLQENLDSLEPYTYVDYEGDELVVSEFYAGENSIAIDMKVDTIAINREDLPQVINQFLAKAGINVHPLELVEDPEGGPHYSTHIDVRDGARHPGTYGADVDLECILADIAFLTAVYEQRRQEEETTYTITEKGQKYLELLESKEEWTKELFHAYLGDGDGDLDELPAWVQVAWQRVADRTLELFLA